MIKVYGINGSPRKSNNTATLLKSALNGFTESCAGGVESELINIYDYNYTGCMSCFECKRINGANYGKCSLKDGLMPVLDKLNDADCIIFATPVYLTQITGQLQCLLERFLFSKLVYDENLSSLAKKRIPVAFIYSMNVTEEGMKKSQYERNFAPLLSYFERIISKPLTLHVFNTLQFNDYSLYHNTRFSYKDKREWHEKQFHIDCENAHNLGVQLCSMI
jgi:multimeric flavodoxin WrbA